ncbi:MAG: esterase family protein, partial [Bryobacteraceae bacterium]|nr:esterase family protein [Bryobacteraceae bacterium]
MVDISAKTLLICLLAGFGPARAQAPAQQAPSEAPQVRTPRPQAPARDPNTPGYVKAKELPDGSIPSAKENGNFILGPTHNPAREMTAKEGVPKGEVYEFIMESRDSKIYPGVVREPNSSPRPDPSDPSKLLISTRPAPYTRKVAVYVPKQYVPGTEAPLLVGADGPDRMLFTALDNLIAEKRVPAMIAVS